MLPVERQSLCDRQSVDWRFESLVSARPGRHGDETVESSRARQSRPWVDTRVHTRSTPQSQRLGRAVSSRQTEIKAWTTTTRTIKMSTTVVFRSRRDELCLTVMTTSRLTRVFWRHDRDQWRATLMTSHVTWLHLDLAWPRLHRRDAETDCAKRYARNCSSSSSSCGACSNGSICLCVEIWWLPGTSASNYCNPSLRTAEKL